MIFFINGKLISEQPTLFHEQGHITVDYATGLAMIAKYNLILGSDFRFLEEGEYIEFANTILIGVWVVKGIICNELFKEV